MASQLPSARTVALVAVPLFRGAPTLTRPCHVLPEGHGTTACQLRTRPYRATFLPPASPPLFFPRGSPPLSSPSSVSISPFARPVGNNMAFFFHDLHRFDSYGFRAEEEIVFHRVLMYRSPTGTNKTYIKFAIIILVSLFVSEINSDSTEG